MSAWPELQHKSPSRILTILLLLLTIPSCLNANEMQQHGPRRTLYLPHKEAASRKRMSGGPKVDIHRLYDAYRERLRETSDNTKYHAGSIDDVSGLNEEGTPQKYEVNDKDTTAEDVKAKLLAMNTELREKANKSINRQYSPMRPSESADNNIKMLTKQKHKVEHIEEMPKHNMDPTITKQLDENKKKSLKAERLEGNKLELPEPDADNQLEKLNQEYQQFLSVWKKSLLENKKEKAKVPAAETDFADKPFRLSALNDLMNVIENIRQTNVLEDIVKAINDGMNQETPTAPGKDVPKRVQRAQAPSNPTVSATTNVQSGNKSGSLYDAYRKKLNEILTAPKNQLNSSVDQGKDTPSSNKSSDTLNTPVQCHCDETRSVEVAVNSVEGRPLNELTPCQCEATKNLHLPINGDATKVSNTLTACHCAPTKGDKLVNTAVVDAKKPDNKDYKKEPLDKETKLIGGLKPYYLSNSKQRQMVWNEVPLIRPGAAQSVDKPKTEEIAANNTQTKIKNININYELPMKRIIDPPVGNGYKNGKATQSKLTNRNQKQLEHILKVLGAKHRATSLKKSMKRGLFGMDTVGHSTNNVAFPEVLVNQIVPSMQQKTGDKIIEDIARQLTVSPVEMAHRIASSSGTAAGQCLAPVAYANYQTNSASQTLGSQNPGLMASVGCMPNVAGGQQNLANLGPVLDKILQRLQAIQSFNENSGHGEKLPCCFAEPTDGAPCDLTGSWESAVLGIRINIQGKIVVNPKQTCVQPQPKFLNKIRYQRTCAKITPDQIKEQNMISPESGRLNITIQETTPPRAHELLENLEEWSLTGHALSTLGGPILISCRNFNSRLIGSFVGYCRTCGCMDTIFGSWTFCLPSRDCQDITMSFFERRDILRRYTLDKAREEHFKNLLYKQSNFAKREKEKVHV